MALPVNLTVNLDRLMNKIAPTIGVADNLKAMNELATTNYWCFHMQIFTFIRIDLQNRLIHGIIQHE